MDTGFTYMYYPAPSNFTNAAITGGPIHGGTSVVIEGSGFTRGYRSEDDIDLTNLIARCRFTDKPSVVSFRVCPKDPSSMFPNAIPLTVAFDVPTSTRRHHAPPRALPPARPCCVSARETWLIEALPAGGVLRV